MRILLVDDNQTFLSAVQQFLKMLPGLDIVGQAHDGKSALARVRKEQPDLVVLDIAMPGMNGLELARAIQLLEVAPRVIFLSMHDNQAYRVAASELGADFVTKTDFVAELLPRLEAMIEARNRAASPQPTGPAGPNTAGH